MSRHIHLAKLFLHDPSVSRSQTEIFTASAEDNDELQLIILIDFPKSRQDQAYVLDLIIKDCVNTFDQSSEDNPELLLEAILASLNNLLPEITPSKQEKWLRDLNILVAISENGQLHFAQTGTITTWLIREGQMLEVSEKPEQLNILKIFSNVTSGVINPGESILFTTPALTDYLSEVKIKQTIAALPPLEACNRLEQYLQEVPAFVTFAAVIAKFEALQTAPQRMAAPAQRVETVVRPATKRPAYTYEPEPEEIEQPTRPTRRAQRITRSPGMGFNLAAVFKQLRYAWQSLILYFRLLGSLLKRFFHGLAIATRFIFNRSYRTTIEHTWWNTFDQWLEGIERSFRSFRGLQRIILITSLILLIVVLNSIVFLGQGRQITSKSQVYNETLLTVSEKQAEADSHRAYQDDKGAESIYLEIDSLLKQLEPLNKDQEQQIAEILEKNNRQLNEVRHINYVDAPLELYNVATLGQTVSSLVLKDNNLYISAPDGLYMLGSETKKIAGGTFTQPRLLVGNKNLFLLDGTAIWRLDNETLTPATLPLSDSITRVDSALLYADNLYLLDRQAGIIIKHSGDRSNFKAGTSWLQDQAMVSTFEGFAIDGNIYATTNQGEIYKLFKGQRVAFDYQKPNPAFGPGSQIITTTDSDFLYILDPANKRVAIIDKSGNIKDQFTSPKFDNLKSIAIDKEEKSLYLLNGTTVYQVAINK